MNTPSFPTLLRPAGCWPLLALLAVAAPAAVAEAQQSVVMLGLISEDGDDGLATELSDSVYQEAAQVAEWNLSSNRPSLSQMTMVNDCEMSSESCRATIGSGLGAQQVVYGTLARVGDGRAVSVQLMMFDSSGGAIVASAQTEIDPQNRAALPTVASGLLRELRGLPPLEPMPVQAPPAGGPPQAAPAPEQAGAVDTDDHESPWEPRPSGGGSNDWAGYTLLGVAGVSLGLTVYSWLQISAANDDPIYTDYRQRIHDIDPDVPDVCVEAGDGAGYGLSAQQLESVRDICSSGETFELLQYVFLGTAALAGGLGAYFLLDGDGESDRAGHRPRRSFALQPSVGRDRAMVRAMVAF
ncbi:MAG: hypothetical protein OEZ06_00175 [Myxococcales bacterium]|nr:hypothetical protein [Myxococcales bacterium]